MGSSPTGRRRGPKARRAPGPGPAGSPGGRAPLGGTREAAQLRAGPRGRGGRALGRPAASQARASPPPGPAPARLREPRGPGRRRKAQEGPRGRPRAGGLGRTRSPDPRTGVGPCPLVPKPPSHLGVRWLFREGSQGALLLFLFRVFLTPACPRRPTSSAGMCQQTHLEERAEASRYTRETPGKQPPSVHGVRVGN